MFQYWIIFGFFLVIFIFSFIHNSDEFNFIGNIIVSFICSLAIFMTIIPGCIYYYFQIESSILELLLTVISFGWLYLIIIVLRHIDKFLKKNSLFIKNKK